jgi:hypothetical protein
MARARMPDGWLRGDGFRDAKAFYAMFSGLVAIAAGIVLIPGAPLGVVTEAVEALAGLLLPSVSVFLLHPARDGVTGGSGVTGGQRCALRVRRAVLCR